MPTEHDRILRNGWPRRAIRLTIKKVCGIAFIVRPTDSDPAAAPRGRRLRFARDPVIKLNQAGWSFQNQADFTGTGVFSRIRRDDDRARWGAALLSRVAVRAAKADG